jgi:hypothetical protein
MKHNAKEATAAEYAIGLELACGARISELTWRSTFERIDDTPGYIKQVSDPNPNLNPCHYTIT